MPAPLMDDATKVIVSTYEELPRRHRPISRVASSSSTAATRAKASASAPRQAGSYSRRALLLAYAQQLRRRRRGAGGQQSGEPLLLEWGKWKAGHPVAGGDGAGAAVRWAEFDRNCLVSTFERTRTNAGAGIDSSLVCFGGR